MKYILLILFPYLALSQPITINNELPRLDTEGNIVDAHDGRIIKFEDEYYWYGTAYGTTNGFTTANEYHCYSSADLTTWQHEGSLLSDAPEGVYYRPHVIYNERTKKYVLWYNWYPQLWDGQFGVATSDSPEGPFTIVNSDVKMAHSEIGLGDFGLFVDDDQKAYLSYNTIQDHQVSVELLQDDYTSSTLKNGGFITKHMEAGAMFKRDGIYYLLTDYTCCFCNYGSGARVYMSMLPLEGYQYTGNINRTPGIYAQELNDGVRRRNEYAHLKKVDEAWQSIEIHPHSDLPIEHISIDVFTGNRPENCGDVSNPRVHPPISAPVILVDYWHKGEWLNAEVHEMERSSTALNEELRLSVKSISSSKIRLRIGGDLDLSNIYFSEVEISAGEFDAFITGPGIHSRPIIPAQQSYIMEVHTPEGIEHIWIGDLWGSASDNVKGHDYQYWSAPLEFRGDGTIKAMKWEGLWQVTLAN